MCDAYTISSHGVGYTFAFGRYACTLPLNMRQKIRTNKMGYKKGRYKNKPNAFYHSPAWRKVRRLVLQRDNFLCQHCLVDGRIRPATEVHHIKPLKDYPELSLDMSNLIGLCWECHELTKLRKLDVPIGVRVIKA